MSIQINRHKQISLLMIVFISSILFFSACSNQTDQKTHLAYVSANIDGAYEQMFKELSLGLIFDFNLKPLSEDQGWVTMWVEAYHDGEVQEPTQLVNLSFELGSGSVKEGHIGLGMLSPKSDYSSLFLYSPSGKSIVNKIDPKFFPPEAPAATWEYAIGKEPIALEAGEPQLLAVYRQAENSLGSFNLQDEKELEQMIQEDAVVFLLKMKIEEQEG